MRLAAQRTLAGDLEHVRGLLDELNRCAAVELRQELRRLVEVIRADLEQLFV